MKGAVIALGMLISFFALAQRENEDPLFYGDVSGNFIIRWAFQDFADHVFDPRTDRYVWPTSSKGVTFDPEKVKTGDIIFVRDALLFYKTMHSKIPNPYIIITHGECLDAMKEEHLELLEEEKVIAWFGIHASKKIKHPKFFMLPIGVIQVPDHYTKKAKYHALFKELRETAEHKHLLYLNFADVNKPERKKVRKMFIDEPYCKHGKRQSFKSYLKEMAECKFTLSPKGLGPDCYRTWESLLVGSIPIVRSSQLNPLYKKLPVLIIENWEDITVEFLEQKYKEIRSRKYDLKRLYMEYWVNKIKKVQKQFLAAQKGFEEYHEERHESKKRDERNYRDRDRTSRSIICTC